MAGTGAKIDRRSRDGPAATRFWTPGRVALAGDLLVFLVATATLSFLVGAVGAPSAASDGGGIESGGFAPEASATSAGSTAGGSSLADGTNASGAESPSTAADVSVTETGNATGDPARSGPFDEDAYATEMETVCSGVLPGADPRVQDIYVEVDTTGNVTLDERTLDGVRAAFADAPVANANGSTGMRVHLVRSDAGLPERGPVDNRRGPGAYDDVWDYRSAHFDNAGAGYYYLLLTSDASYAGNARYAGAATNGTAVAESYDSPDIMTSLILHELGHAFGLGYAHPGVDSREYDRAAYESVMNYNVLYEVESYSDGTDGVGVDEWDFVADRRYQPRVSVPESGTCPGGA